MSGYWLTPIVGREPLVLGGGRLKLEPDASVAAFRERLAAHPRALPLFKANMLAADESYESCGAGEMPFRLDDGRDIVFDGERLVLSHCAEAMLDRLPGTKAIASLSGAHEAEGSEDTEEIRGWLRKFAEWRSEGYGVILLKEE